MAAKPKPCVQESWTAPTHQTQNHGLSLYIYMPPMERLEQVSTPTLPLVFHQEIPIYSSTFPTIAMKSIHNLEY